MSRTRVALVVVAVVALLAVVAGAAWYFTRDDDSSGGGGRRGHQAEDQDDPARDLADRFAKAWVDGSLADVPAAVVGSDAPTAKGPGEVAVTTAVITAGLGPADGDRPASVEVTGIDRSPAPSTGSSAGPPAEEATATLRVRWKLDSTRTWTYDTELALARPAGAGGTAKEAPWQVAWTPATVEPTLKTGDLLRARRVAAKRGDVVGPDGQAIVSARPVVEVSIQKDRSPDPAGLARTVAVLVGVDPEALVLRVAAAKPGEPLSVVTLRREAYDAIRDKIQPLPGTVFREGERSLSFSRDFARALLGTVGRATAEIVKGSAGTVAPGDETGLSGLLLAQNATLAGTAGLVVEAVPATAGQPARPLKDFPAKDGTPVQITLDQRVQTTADAVMAGAPKPAALVAIRASTGDVLAVANGPSAISSYNRAMVGHYPPGSTFKVASGLTYLEHGLTPDTPVDCPATITIGKVFKNAGGEVLGTVPFRKDFADSCNTAFVGQSKTITPAQLAETAGLLGYRELELGVPVFGGSVPADGDATQHAAGVIGQGEVEASPFAVALASASVASGRSVQPRLVIDPAKPQPVLGPELPPVPVAQLRDLMREVVTGGTGTALAGVPGGEVRGKTGTAEFGPEIPLRTHAWFTGYQGDVAFAVLVEDGGFGGDVAAPIAADFLTRLAG